MSACDLCPSEIIHRLDDAGELCRCTWQRAPALIRSMQPVSKSGPLVCRLVGRGNILRSTMQSEVYGAEPLRVSGPACLAAGEPCAVPGAAHRSGTSMDRARRLSAAAGGNADQGRDDPGVRQELHPQSGGAARLPAGRAPALALPLWVRRRRGASAHADRGPVHHLGAQYRRDRGRWPCAAGRRVV